MVDISNFACHALKYLYLAEGELIDEARLIANDQTTRLLENQKVGNFLKRMKRGLSHISPRKNNSILSRLCLEKQVHSY